MYINSSTSYFDTIELLGTMKGTVFTGCSRGTGSISVFVCYECHLKTPPNLVPTSHTCVKPVTVSFLFAIHLLLQPLTILL